MQQGCNAKPSVTACILCFHREKERCARVVSCVASTLTTGITGTAMNGPTLDIQPYSRTYKHLYHTWYIIIYHSFIVYVRILAVFVFRNCGTCKLKYRISELRIPFLSNVRRHFMYCQRSTHTMTSTMPIVVSNLRQRIAIRQLSDIRFCKLQYALF